MSNLYKISQNENNGWDTYDSVIVVADSPDEARKIHPGAVPGIWTNEECWEKGNKRSYAWASSPDLVNVELIGTATSDFKAGTTILASFNAG